VIVKEFYDFSITVLPFRYIIFLMLKGAALGLPETVIGNNYQFQYMPLNCTLSELNYLDSDLT